MLVIDVREVAAEVRRLSFTRHTLALGRGVPTLTLGRGPSADDCNLTSPRVHDLHARLEERDGHLDLVPVVHEQGETTLDGKAVHTPSRLALGSVVGLGDTAITIVAFTPIVAPDFETSEGDFVKPLRADPNDVATRLVYADMLEEKGWLVRAEFLRVQVRLVTGQALEGDREAGERLFKKLATARLWREAVKAPLVTPRCPLEAGAACPVRWGSAPSPSICGKCGHAVAYASS